MKNIPDFTARQLMQEKLQGEQGLWDYTRKLGILRECIYGVDIQTIAVEISRLRCFLSLMVDEKIEENKPNLGIMPLPNLAFKFVCANTLVGLPQRGQQVDSQAEIFEKDADAEELKHLREKYFTVQNAQQKQTIQQEFENVQKKMFERFLQFNQNIQGVKSNNYCHGNRLRMTVAIGLSRFGCLELKRGLMLSLGIRRMCGRRRLSI
ncbi:MAG: hypothetical protein BWK79_18330 [Beggiatoa sp. IS2]|nr:MAG: hypothetical protein BWK79_18330 [Beggiatoa sp. IS2]